MKKSFKLFIGLFLPVWGFLCGCQPSAIQPIPTTPSHEITKIASPAYSIIQTSTPTVQPSPTPRLGCADTRGVIKNVQVEENGFRKPMDVNVYLPPCYSNNYPGGYPVLYLIHGQSFTNDQWIRLGITEQADVSFLSGYLKPFVIVMPREEYYLEDWNHSSFGDNLAKGLVPWIDRNYHTCSTRSCRGIGGLSRGATWSIVLGLSYWEQFGIIGAHSLPGSPYTEATSRDYFKEMGRAGLPRLYLDIGDEDGLRSGTQSFRNILQKYDIPHEWHLNQGGHNEEYWKGHVREYLLWYGQAWN